MVRESLYSLCDKDSRNCIDVALVMEILRTEVFWSDCKSPTLNQIFPLIIAIFIQLFKISHYYLPVIYKDMKNSLYYLSI